MGAVTWDTPSSLTGYFTTELNSLADSTSDTTGFSAAGAEISNATAKNRFLALELVLATQGSARTAGAFVAVYINYAADGSTYDDTSNKAFAEMICVFSLDAATTARRLTKVNIPIPPVDFKLLVLNDTGQAFASSGNTLKYITYNETVA
jgi:hypothetical protein